MRVDIATKEDFEAAPLGTPYMEACETCGQDTGRIVLKDKAPIPWRAKMRSSQGYHPTRIVTGERCEFCLSLGAWMTAEGIDPKETGKRYGMAKIVLEDNSGVRETVALVPFDETERTVTVGDVQVELNHGMILKAVEDGEQHTLVTVLEEGVQ